MFELVGIQLTILGITPIGVPEVLLDSVDFDGTSTRRGKQALDLFPLDIVQFMHLSVVSIQVRDRYILLVAVNTKRLLEVLFCFLW
jgi:hypothetical protein